MRDIVIASVTRTPIGSFNGSLKGVTAVELGVVAVQGAIARAGIDPAVIDSVIMGNVLQAGQGQNPARQVAVKAGIPEHVPAITLNMVCASGLQSVISAAQMIKAGDADVIVAGGMESMSNAPYLLPDVRQGYRMGDRQLQDCMIKDGLWDVFNNYHMGITAENIAEKWRLTRKELDLFSLESQRKAEEAITKGLFKDEIAPVQIAQRKGTPFVISEDEYPRFGLNIADLEKLKPAFKKEGLVTAGNSSGINDGAAAMVVMSRETAEGLGIKALAAINSYASVGVDPAFMGTGPVPASQKALKIAGWSVNDLDIIEANEAFAAQALVVNREMGWDTEKVNIYGGAIALGHPIGASGARIVVTLLNAMNANNAQKGLATLCVGGGQGVAVTFECY